MAYKEPHFGKAGIAALTQALGAANSGTVKKTAKAPAKAPTKSGKK